MDKEQEDERLKSIKPTARLSWSLNIECPKCKVDIDLVDVFSAAQLSLSEFVFINPDTGTPYTKNINRDIFNPAAKRAGVSIKLNNFGRHSWGQQMADKGIDFNIISKGLGHSSVETTKSHYADPSMDVLRRVVDGDRVIKIRKVE